MYYPKRNRPITPVYEALPEEPDDEPDAASESARYLERWSKAQTDEERESASLAYIESWLSEAEQGRSGRRPDPVMERVRESEATVQELVRRRYVTELAHMTESEMKNLNAQQRRNGDVVTYLSPAQQRAWQRTPRPGPHMAVR